MAPEDMAVMIRDALDVLDPDQGNTIKSVTDDFDKLWVEMSNGETFLVKVTRIED